MNLLLQQVCWHDRDALRIGDIRIIGGMVTNVSDVLQQTAADIVLPMHRHLLYPALVNAHDHLEMNLYGHLGKPPYANYVQWASDVYKPRESPVREIEKVSINDRLLWGGVKNMIAGVGTVVHHNPWNGAFGHPQFPVKVVPVAWAHSLALAKNVKQSFPKDGSPFVIHAAEGTDALAAAEILQLDDLGLLNNNTTLVHGVAINEQSATLINTRGASLAWCPASNMFMFDQTANLHLLKSTTNIAIGTDSTMTGSPTLLHELKCARNTSMATKEQLFQMVTATPCRIFSLTQGTPAVGMPADFFVAPKLVDNYFENLLQIEPRHITFATTGGTARLADNDIDLPSGTLPYQLTVQGQTKRTTVDVPALLRRINKTVPTHILEQNALWAMIDG